MRKNVNEIIQAYINKGRLTLQRKIKRLEDKSLSTKDAVLRNHSVESVKLFLQREDGIQAKLSQCKDEDELSKLVFDTFMDIPGISEGTLFSYIYHMAYLHDIPTNPSCEGLLYPSANKKMAAKGISIQQLKKELCTNTYVKDKLTNLELVDLINRTPSLIHDYPFNE